MGIQTNYKWNSLRNYIKIGQNGILHQQMNLSQPNGSIDEDSYDPVNDIYRENNTLFKFSYKR